MTNHETARDLLNRAESYLSALHGSVARHDQLAANLACAGCELRDQITAELGRDDAVSVPPPATPADDQAALRDRIAEALRPGSRDRSGQYPEGLMRDVDAVLAVLPAAVSGPCVAGEQQNETPEPPVCGRTKSVAGTEYPPCGRPPGHEEAYCRSADGKQHFLAVGYEEPHP